MPTWLSDPPRTAYLLLAVIALASVAAAWFLVPEPPRDRATGKIPPNRNRRRLHMVAAICAAALVALIVADRTWESDREQIVRKLLEMSEGVAERDLDKVFQHVSDSFRYGSANKAALRSRGESALQTGQVTEIPIWDIQVPPSDSETRQLKVVFRFKVKGNALNENQFIGEGLFVKEGSEWRLAGVEVYSPTGMRDRYQIPGL